jgi:hypothetical protein
MQLSCLPWQPLWAIRPNLLPNHYLASINSAFLLSGVSRLCRGALRT